MNTRAIWAGLTAAICLGLAATGAAAATLPRVPTATGTPGPGFFQARPSQITYTGDGSGFLAGRRRTHHRHAPLHWRSWTSTRARGSGYNWLDDCRPDCATGTYHLYPVRLRPFRPRHVHGHRIFTRMRVVYTGTKPARAPRRETWRVVYSSGAYSWSFPSQ